MNAVIKGQDLELNFDFEQAKSTSVVTDHQSLQQNLLLRLLMDKGQLAYLGEPNYGSNIHDFIGQLHTPQYQQLLSRLIKKTLMQDYRVAEVTQIDILPRSQDPSILDIDIVVKAIDGKQLNLAVATHV